MTDLSDLIERVRAATGPDRRLDADIMRAVCLSDINDWWYETPWGTLESDPTCPPITESIDAITALIEAKLPGWQYGSERRRDTNGGASAWVAPNEDANRARAATEPLARTLAFLLAVQATGAK
jgi:hypothetical protein